MEQLTLIKGICWEVDCFFPIWKTVMTGRKRKKKNLIGLLQFPWVDFFKGESFGAYPMQYCCNLRASHSQVRVQIPRQAEAWQPPGDRIPRQVGAGKACWPTGIAGLADLQAGWGVTTFWGTGTYAGQGRSASWDPWTGDECPQVLQHDSCWEGLRGCKRPDVP